MREAELFLLLGALACASSPAQAAEDVATQTAAAAAASQDRTAPLPSAPMRPSRPKERAPTTFPHAPHLGIDCKRCHARVAGHERHANVACRQCHEAPAPTSARASASDCGSCHHARSQTFGCRHCHDRDPERPPPEFRLTLMLPGTASTRAVSFPHARHVAVDCTTCHTPPAQAVATAQCVGCHERHHQPAAACDACHRTPRADVHDAAVHRGCGGGGCHQDAAVLALPLSRPVCLVCHPAQASHVPGGDCASCHDLRSRTGNRSEGR